MLPVWVLMPAQVLHSVSHYVISSMVRTVWLQLLKATHREYQRLTVRQQKVLQSLATIYWCRVPCQETHSSATCPDCLSTRARQQLWPATLLVGTSSS